MARNEVPREVDGFSLCERHIAESYVWGKKAVVIAEESSVDDDSSRNDCCTDEATGDKKDAESDEEVLLCPLRCVSSSQSSFVNESHLASVSESFKIVDVLRFRDKVMWGEVRRRTMS